MPLKFVGMVGLICAHLNLSVSVLPNLLGTKGYVVVVVVVLQERHLGIILLIPCGLYPE
jgi:hypothetical protein